VNSLDLNGGPASSNATPTSVNRGTPTNLESGRSKSARREREPEDVSIKNAPLNHFIFSYEDVSTTIDQNNRIWIHKTAC
jgi:hypothetical protein